MKKLRTAPLEFLASCGPRSFGITKKKTVPQKMTPGTWIPKAQRHPIVSHKMPPKAMPEAWPNPKARFKTDWYVARTSIGTKSLSNTAPMAEVPPAPRPHKARAAISDPMLCALEHQTTAMPRIAKVTSMIGLRPMVSESGANMDMQAVEVIRNEVDSQDAEFEEWNSDVMTGWLEAMMVPSKQAI